MTYERERTVAIEAVLKACQLCTDVQQRLTIGDKTAKTDRSPVTIADFGSQAIIVSHLLREFPNDPIVGEEEASLLRQEDQAALKASVLKEVNLIEPDLNEHEVLAAIDYGAKPCDFTSRYWTLDPIDGTKGFLRGDQYAVALALVEDGQPVLGVLGCPNLPLDWQHPENGRGALFVAVKGQGAFRRAFDGARAEPIQVDSITNAADAVFCESVESEHASQDDHAKIAAMLGVGTEPFRIDSQCKYAIVARGDASIYLRLTTYRAWIWDHAAGVIIVQEAGGNVTDTLGKPLDFSAGRRLFNNSGVIATNGKLHEAVISSIQQLKSKE